jgi:hypothetical protein
MGASLKELAFVSEGHGFSRADKPFVVVIPSGLQPARNLHFFPGHFSRAAQRGTAKLSPEGYSLRA